MKIVATGLAVAAAAVIGFAVTPSFAGGAGCGCTSKTDTEMAGKEGKSEKKNIVETAAAAGQFETLLAAATAAGLADTLSEGGPFTVLAPTDKAFAELPAGTVETLLKPENKEQLKAVLLYHVIDGKVKSEQVASLESATTLQGADVSISAADGKVTINDAEVIAADVKASNGVIHVINKVLLPPAE